MKYISLVSAVCLALVLPSVANAVEQAFDSEKFIEAAAVNAIAEIETAKLALQKSPSADVQAYAAAMISEQQESLNRLHMLAEKAHVAIASDEQLRRKAWLIVLERRGMSFDASYAAMRMTERDKAVQLYRAAILAKDAVVAPYAQAELPVLMRELHQAQVLVRAYGNQTDEQAELQEESRLTMKM